MKIIPNQIPFFSYIILKFLKYLENEDSQSGYLLYNKGKLYSNNIYFYETPNQGDRTYIDIKVWMERPSLGGIKRRMNIFLEGLTV